MSTRGHLDRIEAFEFAQYLCLVDGRSNPTPGWANWFSPISSVPDVYEFLQEPPTGTILPVTMPFQVTGVFMSNGVREVAVRHLVNAKPTDMRGSVRPISQNEEAYVSALIPASMQSYLRNRGAERTIPWVGASFSMRLGTADVPLVCLTAPSHCLETELPILQDQLPHVTPAG